MSDAISALQNQVQSVLNSQFGTEEFQKLLESLNEGFQERSSDEQFLKEVCKSMLEYNILDEIDSLWRKLLKGNSIFKLHSEHRSKNGALLLSANFGILHNLVRHCDDNKSHIQDGDGQNVVASFTKSDYLAVRTYAFVILAFCAKEGEESTLISEAEYADKLRVTMLPLMLESGYKPSGWLGLLLGQKLYVDLASEENLQQKFEEVVEQITVLQRADSCFCMVEAKSHPFELYSNKAVLCSFYFSSRISVMG